MKLFRDILVVALLVICLIGGYVWGRKSVKAVRTTIVRVDTLFYERPQPIKILPHTLATVRVAKMVFAPCDTVIRGIADTDSVNIQVSVERKQYGDSTYRAQVSGPRIGDLSPTLDWIEVYNRTNTVTNIITKRSRFAVTAGIGAAYTPQGFQPYVGVGVGVVLWQW